MADQNQDFLQSDFPLYAVLGILIFLLYRSFVGRAQNEPIQPAWMTKGVFPAAFMTFVGSLACHEMWLYMISFPGGLTAWLPAILSVAVASWAAYRGQRAASGGEVGVASLAAIVALVVIAVSWLITDGPEPPQEPLSKAQLKKLAKEAARRAAKGIVEVPKTRQLFLEKGEDVATDQLDLALVVVVVVALILGLVNGPGVFPRTLTDGAFPACFFVLTGVMACNSFLRQARSYEGGCIEDFFPAFGLTLASAYLAHKGYLMQTTSTTSS